ncbi:hypothetical protein NMY22_g9748 [Coprinellus aureogranulatus]|nr:hypothetical protein NMY22_g9748 [Coprinellus aureogranulatus]
MYGRQPSTSGSSRAASGSSSVPTQSAGPVVYGQVTERPANSLPIPRPNFKRRANEEIPPDTAQKKRRQQHIVLPSASDHHSWTSPPSVYPAQASNWNPALPPNPRVPAIPHWSTVPPSHTHLLPPAQATAPLAMPNRSSPATSQVITPPFDTQLLPPVQAMSPLPMPSRSSWALPDPTFNQVRVFHPIPTQQPATAFFPDANNFNIGQQNIHVGPNIQQAAASNSKTVFELLEPYVSYGASHNSDEGNDNPKCSPETREAIQAEVVGLVRDGDVYEQSKRMTWLTGPAGAGKSAIAGSVAATCERLGVLAGTFFFSSVRGAGETRRTKRCVITTLAYQLARHKGLHEYKVQLLVAIEENPDVFRKCLQDQAQLLILGPLGAIHSKCDTSSWPRGILYDGLDEVQAIQYHNRTREDLVRKDEDDQNEILRPIITKFFKSTALASTVVLFLDSKYNPDADIKRFLQSKFAIIRNESGMSNPSWPGEDVTNQLVEMSSGQFIVPSTILRYIESGIPQAQLEDIMQVARGRMGAKNPFALLDAVYTHVINRSPDPQLAVTWMRLMITDSMELAFLGDAFLGASNYYLPAHFWKKFLEDTDGQFYHLLKNLASLLSVPPHNDHYSSIKTYHKSLTDFLTSKDRCGDLYVERTSVHEFAARRYVVILQNRGPKVPLPSPDGLYNFLDRLLSSTLFPVLSEYFSGSRRFALFLKHVCEPSILALAACDVAWWTRFAMGKLRTFLEGMYCCIHSMLCRRLRTGANDVCLPACVHWREGILTEARALGWCVHELGEVPLEQLSQMETRESNRTFRKLGDNQKCAVCQPSPDGQSE